MKIFNPDLLKRWAEDHKGKDIIIDIEVRTGKRSNPQNAYYWGVVIMMVQAALNEYGNEFTRQETHEFLKAKFNFKEVEVSEGHYLDIPVSTTKLDTVGFMEYILKIQQFGSEMLGIVIPDPNQY